jgi:methionine aminopeptidase
MTDDPNDKAKADEAQVERAARDTITNLQKGIVGSRTVKDIGDAVQQATRDGGLRRATGHLHHS